MTKVSLKKQKLLHELNQAKVSLRKQKLSEALRVRILELIILMQNIHFFIIILKQNIIHVGSKVFFNAGWAVLETLNSLIR